MSFKVCLQKLKSWNIFLCNTRTHACNHLWLKQESGNSAQGLCSVLFHTWFDRSYSLPNTLHNTSCFMPKNDWKRHNQSTSYHMVIRATDPCGHDLIWRKDKNISAFNYVTSYVDMKWYHIFGEVTCFPPKSHMHTINLRVKHFWLCDSWF